MKNKLISYKTLFYCLLLPILCIQYIQAAVTDSQVANWKDNKTAAFLLMFDDGLNSAYQVAIPELLKRKMIATFYVNPGGNKWPNPAVESPNQWENLIPKTGMVYGDHTWTHNGAADLATEDNEIRLCQEKIMSIFYSDGKPHLISYGQPGVTTWFSYGAELTAILAKYNLISRPTFDGHGTVYALQTIKQMLALADKAIANKGMEYLITHGVERRVSEGDPNWGFQDFWALNKDTLRGVLDGLAARRDRGDLWITDHISQYKYQMERDNKPTFQVVKSVDNEIQLTMSGTLNHDLFDLPLTVITQVPGTWVSAYVTQGLKTYSVPVDHGIAQYDALPNGTLITLTKNTDPTAPIGTATTTYLVQPGGSGAVWSGVTGKVVDLTVHGKSLNEWYKTTTFNIGDEIWLIKGTYTLTDSIVTKGTETIRGGFSGTEQTIGARAKGTNAWDFTNETIIDGNALVRGIVSTTGATIEGLTIQNCAYPSTSVGGNAAAVKITNSSILQNCIVRNNTITGAAIAGGLYAGGVYLTTGAKLLNSYVHHNSCANSGGGGNGGGVSIYQLATVDGCTISNNTAYNAGGGINIIAKTGGALVNNCIISNNMATIGSGGGVNVYNTTTTFTAGLSVTFSNCTISSNAAKTNGGGMSIDVPVTDGAGADWEGNAVNILNCIVSSNSTNGTSGSTGNGGGISMLKGNYTIKGCTINNNVSTSLTTIDNNGGGGIFIPYSYGSTLNLSNSILKGNRIGGGKNVGSAINIDVSTMSVKNCLITGNIGANFHTQGASRQCTYYNCTIAGNITTTGGEAGLNLGWQVSKISTFTNCLFYKSSTNPLSGTINAGQDPVVTYCGFDLAAVPATYASKTGCITGLTSDSFADVANGDWSLSSTSAAIDAGTTIASVTTDITGVTVRPKGAAYDMGAYETNSVTTGIENVKQQFVCFTENHSLKLQGLSSGAQLKVYNMAGALLVNESANSSNISIPLAPGFYMITGVDAGKNFTQKVIVR